MNSRVRGVDAKRLCFLAVFCAVCACFVANGFANLADRGLELRQIRRHSSAGVTERGIGTKYHPDRVLVRCRVGTSRETMLAVHHSAKARMVRELPFVAACKSSR